MNGIQIKSYLFPANSKVTLANLSEVEEIRRFSLQVATNANSYSSLIEKLQQTYGPVLAKREEIRTYWQDEDNDLISFTSDSELTYALELMATLKESKPYEVKANVFKVYVSIKGHEQHKHHRYKRTEEARVHFGVVCDSCDGSIIGNRYKCKVCNDYDLCEECKSMGVHSEHDMQVIALPVSPMFGGKCQRRGGLDRRCRQGHNNNGVNPLEGIMKDMWKGPVPLVGNPEQLKSLGENLKKFLDPFGIDVSYYVDGMTKKEAEKKETTETEGKSVPMDATNSDDIEEVVIEKPLNEVNEGLIPKLVIGSNSKPSAPDQSEEVSLIDLQKSVTLDAPFKEAVSVLNTIAASYGSNESLSAATTSNSGMVDGFSLIEIDKELKIIRAIEQLNSMGYTDDGGWLTRLVSAKNGNINAVLDAITPGPKK